MKTPAYAVPILATVADGLARQMSAPEPYPTPQQWRAQSLTRGDAGTALLHIERAHTGVGTWRTAHTWVCAATQTAISAADDAGIHFGAPAVSFVLHAAGADGIARYATALARLDAHVAALTHHRVDLAEARIARGDRPVFSEYDLLHGLTGIGAHLLQHAPGSDALGRVLTYLVHLTQPLRNDDEILPGWWTGHDPRMRHSGSFPGGHANLGAAHGITGPLALLAQALRRNITVDGHHDAITTITTWLDTWRQDTETGPWWPQWIAHHQIHTGQRKQPTAPLRPSWCYGTPGIARAMQLAAIATHDAPRRQTAERALAACLSDPAQLAQITDISLCHGWAGLYQTAWRAAHDACTSALPAALPRLTELLAQHARPNHGDGDGLLEGNTGLALALHTAAHHAPPLSGWDTFLLIN